MSSYKVYYYNFRGAGEPVRFLLSFANVEFEDARFEEDEWTPMKETMPFGKVPVLEIDGIRYGHSFAILNYLGRKFDLAGSNDLEDLELNGVGMFVYDLVTAFEDVGFYYKESLGENLNKEFIKLLDEKLPYVFGKFEEIVVKNGGHFSKGKFSWVDVYFTSKVEYFNSFLKYAGFEAKADVIGKFPNLQKLYEKVMQQDGVKKWIEKRPEDPYFDGGKKL